MTNLSRRGFLLGTGALFISRGLKTPTLGSLASTAEELLSPFNEKFLFNTIIFTDEERLRFCTEVSRRIGALPKDLQRDGNTYADKIRAALKAEITPIMEETRWICDLRSLVVTGNTEHDKATQTAVRQIIAERKQFAIDEMRNLTKLYPPTSHLPANRLLLSLDFYDDNPAEITNADSLSQNTLYGVWESMESLKDALHGAGYIPETYEKDYVSRHAGLIAETSQIADNAGLHTSALWESNSRLRADYYVHKTLMNPAEDIEAYELIDLLTDSAKLSEAVCARLDVFGVYTLQDWAPDYQAAGQLEYFEKVVHPTTQTTFLEVCQQYFPEFGIQSLKLQPYNHDDTRYRTPQADFNPTVDDLISHKNENLRAAFKVGEDLAKRIPLETAERTEDADSEAITPSSEEPLHIAYTPAVEMPSLASKPEALPIHMTAQPGASVPR